MIDISRPRHCFMCCQIDGEPSGDLIARLLPGQAYVRRVIAENSSFAVIPSLGPLTDGHVLLCTKEHTRSLASLPARLEPEYEELKSALRTTLSRLYGAPTHVFEHGMAAAGDRVPCTVDHTHVHFVPLPGALTPTLPRASAWTSTDGSLAALAESVGGKEYLMYEPPDGNAWIARADDDAPFESQCMRRAFADALGSDSWNWRSDPDPWAAHRAWELVTPG